VRAHWRSYFAQLQGIAGKLIRSLKTQLETALVFNGHTTQQVADIDSKTMANLQTMYADGMLGNQAILNVLGTLTTGVFNYIRQSNSSPYKLSQIINSAYDYIYPPASPESIKQAASDGLKLFMSQAPGFEKVNHG